MSLAWERVHARYRLVDDVLRRVARTGDGTDAERWRDASEVTFGDFGGLLLHVQRQWYTRLQARLDAELEDGDGRTELGALVQVAWRELALAHPAMRTLLDAYADHPDVQAGERRQRQILGLGASAGMAERACA